MKCVVACAITNDKGEILLLRRSKDRKHAPGKWHIMGGTMEPGEAPEATLKRELNEEFGITEFTVLKRGTPIVDDAYDPPYEIYTFMISTKQPLNVDLREHDRWEWTRPENIKNYKPLHPGLKLDLQPLGIEI